MLQPVADGFTFLEGPRWRGDRLWVSDFYSGRVLTVDPAGAVTTELELHDQPSGLGWLPDGRLLVVSMRERRVLRVEDGEPVLHADLSEIATGHCNDMLVDPDGTAWVGNFGFDLDGHAMPATAHLARVTADGSATVAARDLQFPNGIVRLGDTLVAAETIGQRLTAWTVADDGSLRDQRTWADLGAPTHALPDGICLDAEGAIWVADAGQQRCLRVAPGGEVLQTVEVGTHCFAVALGDADRRTLYICTAPTHDAGQLRGRHLAALVSVRVDVAGVDVP